MARSCKTDNMGREAESQRILKFFKVFNDTKYTDQLHIPSAFSLYMQGNLPNKVVFSDRFGNMWRVKLTEVGNKWYFQDGWAKVVEDNAIEHADFLVFQFDGDTVFYFKIFGRNSCEKEGVGLLKFKLDENEKGEEDEEEEELNKRIVIRKSKRSCSSSRKFRSGASAGHKSGGEDVPDIFGARIFRSGELAQPRNPYFVTKMRRDKPHLLYIPSEVIKTFRLELSSKMILRDPLERTWTVNLLTWTDSRTFYTGGWESLCKVNFVDENDKCVCEFLPESIQDLPVMQIQIVRSQNASKTSKMD